MYIPKDLHFDKGGRDKLIVGIRKLSKAVKDTMGPGGHTVVIESPQINGGMTVTKDGVTVANNIDLDDPVENLGARMVKEAAQKTALSAGDGTSSSILLAEALVVKGSEIIESDAIHVIAELKTLANDVCAELEKMSTPITEDKITYIATISANNEEMIGKVVADAYKEVGVKGVVLAQRNDSAETVADIIRGIRLKTGYTHPLFRNSEAKDEWIANNVAVLVTDHEISTIQQIRPIVDHCMQGSIPLLIIGPVGKPMTNNILLNNGRGLTNICVVNPPSFGSHQMELMNDVSVATGATYFSQKGQGNLNLMRPEHLGHATRVVVGSDMAVLTPNEDYVNMEIVTERVAELEQALANTKMKGQQIQISERIACFTGGIGVVKVGGATEMEHKELYDRVDDAIQAVKASRNGVLPGGGVALRDVAKTIKGDSKAAQILRHALLLPEQQILQNSGMTKQTNEKGSGVNCKTGEVGDMLEMGVIDPLLVAQNAIQNSIAAATTVLSTNTILTMAREVRTSENLSPQIPRQE